MKNNLLKQNLFVLAAVVLSWVIGSWLYNDKYSDLWALSLSLLVFYTPLAYLQYNRSIKSGLNEKLNKAVMGVLCIFILLFLYFLLMNIWYHLFQLSDLFYFVIAALLFFALKSNMNKSVAKQLG